MKKLLMGGAWLLSLAAVAAQQSPSEAPVLSKSEYRLPLEEVIAIGRVPYWRQQEAPRWEPPELELQQPTQPRLEWVPHYSRDERDDYQGIHDPLNPQPRTKLFEVHF